MTTSKLINILKIIAENLTQSNIPFALIGVMALSLSASIKERASESEKFGSGVEILVVLHK